MILFLLFVFHVKVSNLFDLFDLHSVEICKNVSYHDRAAFLLSIGGKQNITILGSLSLNEKR